MSSREIAELTGKQHAHVIRDIRSMLDDLKKDDPNLDDPQEDKDARGYTACFHLNRALTDCLLTGYSAVARMKVITRWHELEQQPAQPTFAIPQNLSEALRLAADLADENTELRSENTQLKAQLSRPAPAALSHAATLLEKTARSLRGAGVPKRKALGQALDLVHGQTGINLLPNYSATQDNVSLVVKIVGNAKKYSKDSKYGEFCANGIMPKNKLMGLSKLPVAEMNEAVGQAIELGLLDPCTYQHDKTAFMVRH